jgi:Protein of unknown function (DUF3107)
MDIRIGIVQSMKELEIELPDDTKRDKLVKEIEETMEQGAVLWLTDRKGRKFAVAAERIAYVELGDAESHRTVGFGA